MKKCFGGIFAKIAVFDFFLLCMQINISLGTQAKNI